MHGDEGEAGMDALNILAGHWVSPFQTGWFGQSNFYYWALAITMGVFGTGLGGLRMFVALAGSLMILPFYPLVRQWFGVRVAIIAAVLLAVSDVAIHFSRQEFSNISTPLFLVTGFFFFFRGLRDRRLLNFGLAGYALSLTMYFYLGGRLTLILAGAFIAYLFVLMPLTRLPALYRGWREHQPESPAPGRLAAGGAGHAGQRAAIQHQLIVFALACVCFVTPWLGYFVDHQELWNERVNEKLIFNNAATAAVQDNVNHDPLYLGLRVPTGDDILPLPVVFEPTSLSVALASDRLLAACPLGSGDHHPLDLHLPGRCQLRLHLHRRADHQALRGGPAHPGRRLGLVALARYTHGVALVVVLVHRADRRRADH